MKREEKENGRRAPIARKRNLVMPKEKIAYIKMKWPPKAKEEQDKLADELLQWVYIERPNKLEEFALSRHMSPYRFKHIGDENEYFRECYEIAAYVVGVQLQDGVYERKIDRELAMRMLPVYNREYREWTVESRKLNLPSEQKGPQFVILDRIPDSPLVAEKKTEKEHEDRISDPLE